MESVPGNRGFQEVMGRLDDKIEELEGETETSTNGHLERAYLLRLRGRWDEALVIYTQVAEGPSRAADALFNLGAEAERSGDARRARRLYNEALEALPTHMETLRRIEALAPTAQP